MWIKLCCCFCFLSRPAPSLRPSCGWTITVWWRQLLPPGPSPLRPAPLANVKAFPLRTGTTPTCWTGFWRSPCWWWWRSPRTEAWGFGTSVKVAPPAASWGCPAPTPTRLSLRSRYSHHRVHLSLCCVKFGFGFWAWRGFTSSERAAGFTDSWFCLVCTLTPPCCSTVQAGELGGAEGMWVDVVN